jgi:para-aminobenzoate synthetase component 1
VLYFNRLNKQNFFLLYSGQSNKKHHKSYLALSPTKEFISQSFTNLENFLDEDLAFGYFSYELNHCLENLPKTSSSFISAPNIYLSKFSHIIEYNHTSNKFKSLSQEKVDLSKIFNKTKKEIGKIFVKNIQSNFTKEEYLKKVKTIKEKIKAGEIYQANLTRKFFGEIEYDDAYDIFLKLNEKSPANYSSFLKLGKKYIISSSPELFLSIENNIIKSSPIKGTIARRKSTLEDLKNKEILKNSTKDRAENLMIVDLVRNDIGKNSIKSSVKVENLFKTSTYKTIHHMSSDIIGVKSQNSSIVDVIKGCFPAGSMTGAPKVQAMKICAELEKIDRGIYSGAIGIISNNYCNLSVVIRTIIVEENKFEFQVGGAITNDSDPEKEWQETMDKATGICQALGINSLR